MAGNWFLPFTGDKIQVIRLVGRCLYWLGHLSGPSALSFSPPPLSLELKQPLLGFDVSPLFFCPSTCFPAGGHVLSCVGGRALLVEVAF